MNINKEKLIEALTTDERLGDLTLRDLGKVIKIINEQEPVDDVKETISTEHPGKWIKRPFSDKLVCSECGAEHPYSNLKEIKMFARECPSCHAKMKNTIDYHLG